jgi:hypothetical protein
MSTITSGARVSSPTAPIPLGQGPTDRGRMPDLVQLAGAHLLLASSALVLVYLVALVAALAASVIGSVLGTAAVALVSSRGAGLHGGRGLHGCAGAERTECQSAAAA